MTPEIEHLGHACIRYQYQGMVLVTDPWFYPAFLKSWFPYPDNRHLIDRALSADYIYISHAHEDHFDRDFLKQVDPTLTSLVIPKFRSRYLEKELAKLGFEGQLAPIVLEHGQSTTLPTGVKLTVLVDRSHKEDSALLIETPAGHRFLDSNDCELAIPDWPKDVDLLAAQFSGAFWYPHCYDFDADTMTRHTIEVNTNNIERLFRRIELTGAKNYLPSAGPPVFLDPALMRYNGEATIFGTWHSYKHGFELAFPDVEIHPYLDGSRTDIREYSRYRRGEWGSYYDMPDAFVTLEELTCHFRELQSYNKRFLRFWHKDISVSSSGWVAGSKRSFQIRLGLLADELEESFNPEYFLDVPPRVLRALVNKRITWETALLSMRVNLKRVPDKYDSTLMGLLTFGDRPVQTLTMARQQADQELVTTNGVTHQRWCPHAGEDLTYATVKDGKLTCPRHNWCWDTETGQCISGGDIPLRIERKP